MKLGPAITLDIYLRRVIHNFLFKIEGEIYVPLWQLALQLHADTFEF